MIPNVVRKKEVKYIWYKDYPLEEVRQTLMNCVLKVGKNNKYKKRLEKQEIIYIIEELGLPEQFTIDEWYAYIDDPFINKRLNRVDIEL